MNRAGLLVVIAALALALVTGWRPAQAAEEQRGSTTIAQLLDASIASAPLLSKRAQDQLQLKAFVDGRDLQVIDVRALLDDDEARLLDDLLNSSDVLRQNVLLVHAVVSGDGALAQALHERGVNPEDVVALDLTDSTAEPLTVYVFSRS